MKTLNFNLGQMIEDAEATVTTPLDKLFAPSTRTKNKPVIGLGMEALFQSNNVDTEIAEATEVKTAIGLGMEALFQSNSVATEIVQKVPVPDVTETENIIAELEAKLDEITLERDSLKEKLDISFKMDSSTETLNMITLKKDIASGLEFEFKSFNESLEDEYNEDNFEAYRWTISRMFRTLTRLGVPMMV